MTAGTGGVSASSDTAPTPELRRVGPLGTLAADGAFGVALTGLWHEVSLAGGSVGFVPPVARAEVAAVAAVEVDRLRSGTQRAVAAIAGNAVVGFGILRPGTGLQAHTGYLSSLMVHPDHAGAGLGSAVLTALVDLARELGLERLDLGVRDGMGLAAFYQRFGFVECGRLPGWIRVAPGDDRDLVTFALDLREPGGDGAD